MANRIQNSAALRCTLASIAIALAALMATCSGALAEFCGRFNFSTLGKETRGRQVERALAKVYAANATAADQHRGAATVIHLHPMLLVTAAHVAPDDSAQIRFPKLDDKNYRARVVARSTRNTGGLIFGPQATGSAGHDFAVLLVEQPPAAGVEALEVWFDEIDNEEEHDFAGFARDLPRVVWGGGRLTQQSDCGWRLRETTFNGDSGGAAVSQGGLLVGIVLDGREGGRFDGGAMGQATILPLACVRNEILTALDQAEPAGGANLLDRERSILLNVLQPPPSSGWIDNLRYARALRDLMANPTLIRKLNSQNAIDCPLFKSAIDRKLGYDVAIRLIKFVSQNAKEAGDNLKRIGDQQKAENEALARRLYTAAAISYGEYLTTSGVTFGNATVSAQLAQAALGRADALASLAKISDYPSNTVAAITAAAKAVQAAPEGRTRGLAFAILGNSVFLAGDYQSAIEAYSSAKQAGFDAAWVKKDYKEAFRLRDNIVQPTMAKDYKAVGYYKPLTDDKLRAFSIGAN